MIDQVTDQAQPAPQAAPKHYRMDAEVANLGASMDPGAPATPENFGYTGKGVKMAVATEVLDEEKDEELIESWYEKAAEVEDFEGFQKFVERLLGRYSHTPGTTPAAYVAIALAALKLADGSEQGNINSDQWTKVMWGLVQVLTGTKGEPLRLMRYADLMYPGGLQGYLKIPAPVFDWMKNTAMVSIVDPATKGMEEAVVRHWEEIAKGQVPFGMTIEN
jgi:hypothetical protein